ncbi:XRE family transcriptional regulator [Brevundimonas fluminis]|jgi:phage repressor protein C with HTH and peptisase S24 domain|uniref:XRE family transcriptional regulator n=1 Tax=Brevundimonas fluminis TaxID=2487274 RepID=UPI000F6585EA|nr:helix-turn-helix transcriptional regulator [Brevundimonas fluminis]
MPLSHPRLWRALDRLAETHGLSPSGLARRAGLDPTAFNPSKRETGGRPRWPSTESLNRVLEVTGVSLAEFAALADDPGPAPALPMLGLAQAGLDGFFDEAGLPTGDGWSWTDLPRQGRNLFSLEIVGDSMVPLYRPGDKVIVDRDGPAPRRGDRVVVRTRTGETLAKELAAASGRNLTLRSINPEHADRIVPRTEVDWISRILWVSQ